MAECVTKNEKFSLVADATGRLCIMAEGNVMMNAEDEAVKWVDTVPVSDIHPSRLNLAVLMLTLWKARENGRTFAEEARLPYIPSKIVNESSKK